MYAAIFQRRLLVRSPASQTKCQKENSSESGVLVPYSNVEEDAEDLVHHAHERIRRRRKLGAAPPTCVADASSHDA